MSLLNTLKFLTNHPLSSDRKFQTICRFVGWQISSRLMPYPVIYPFTVKSKLIVQKGMSGATGNLYCGLHEFHDMAFLLHLLRPGDLFVDVGANVGGYTVLASGHVEAETIAIEPAPATYAKLQANIRINDMADRVHALNIALGSAAGVVNFTTSLDTTNHVVVGEEAADTVEISIDTLDNVLEDQSPILLKIDVEGFETEVLKGAKKILQQQSLKAIIIELNGLSERYGVENRKNHEALLGYGFLPYTYDPFKKALQKCASFGDFNTIYIRDIDFVKNRLVTADKVYLRNQAI
ncbi:FkbM family methyltransferase [Chitinophaga filiformis]|uniref:FkbM family methyltransferase n=1 Tax=Chitinophaga filiformis TaxID=104663 RepID=A0ABY4IC20_CHIFI|nr:FkbM family methyltransferase [Chitinophaga filiformis]UPK72764.1 FkbM family methyltransferase [Chitinophaga filiformis]